MNENDVAKEVVDICYRMHTSLGPGLLESAYEYILFAELKRLKLNALRQIYLPVVWQGEEVMHGFRADIIVEEKVILEIKSLDAVAPVHF